MLASDWWRKVTWPECWPLIGWPSPMSGGQWSALPGHCHPRSTILISFWLQITLRTRTNGTSWDTLGRNTWAQHFHLSSVSGCHFDVDQEKLVSDVLCWPGRGRSPPQHWPVDRTLVRLFHHTAMAGLIGTSWGCFVQHMTKWCETQAASPNSKNLKGRVRMVVSEGAKFLDYIDLGIDITPRDSAGTNLLLSAHSLLWLPVSCVSQIP